MARIELDYKINLGSMINAAILILGFLGAAVAYYADQRLESQAVKVLQERVQVLSQADVAIGVKIAETQQKIADATQSTTNRLSTLEAQSAFIIRQIDRLEATLARPTPRPN